MNSDCRKAGARTSVDTVQRHSKAVRPLRCIFLEDDNPGDYPHNHHQTDPQRVPERCGPI